MFCFHKSQPGATNQNALDFLIIRLEHLYKTRILAAWSGAFSCLINTMPKSSHEWMPQQDQTAHCSEN